MSETAKCKKCYSKLPNKIIRSCPECGDPIICENKYSVQNTTSKCKRCRGKENGQKNKGNVRSKESLERGIKTRQLNHPKTGTYVDCIRCGNKIYVNKWNANRKYCSKKCQFSVYESKREKLACPQCKKEFWVPPSVAIKRKYCSKKCKDDYERDYVKRRCKNCMEYFFLARWELNKGKGTFCSRKCFQDYGGETSIEALIRKVLEKKGINFKQEVRIGKYYADFLILNSKLIIECDGEYWHRSDFAKKRDSKKDKFLALKGYKIYRFTEKEIKESKGNCAEGLFLAQSPLPTL